MLDLLRYVAQSDSTVYNLHLGVFLALIVRKQYSDKEVKQDIKTFFLNNNHPIYQYATALSCDKDSPYHKKQIEVLFEGKYYHWVTDRAVQALIQEGFLKSKTVKLRILTAQFVYRHDLRHIIRSIRQRARIVERYSDEVMSKATGDQAELLFSFMFRMNGFTIVARNTNEYRNIKWSRTNHNLDFIVERDGISYGVEVKNTFPYIEQEEFDIKLEICQYLGIIPIFILRWASGPQIEKLPPPLGTLLVFKTKIFPPGQEPLIRDMWNFMRLPVSIWKEIPLKVQGKLMREHSARLGTTRQYVS